MKTIPNRAILLILFIIFTSNINSQSGWVQQNSGITGNVTFIEAFDANNAFVGNPGYKTTNGGANWFLTLAPTITEMQMVSAVIGYAAAGLNYPFKTTNGGLNWIALPIAAPENLHVSFINETTGFICGLHDMDYLDLFKTTNGGINWTLRGVSIASWPQFTQAFNDVKMLSNNIYYITYYVFQQMIPPLYTVYYLKKTTDDGSWFSTMMWDSTTAYYEMQFPSAATGFVYTRSGNQYRIIKSVNDNWGATISLTTTNAIQGIEFPSVNTGYAVCAGGVMYKTTNGGSSWYTLGTGTTRNLKDVKFINELTGWVVGDSGLILKTTTGGENPVVNSVSGTVRYQDNNQPVSSGYVKAVRFDTATYSIITVDSAQIQSNGTYTLSNCPPITIDIMAYENDEEELSFVATYYVSTIYWQNATHVKPDSNLTNINIGVYRIVNSGANRNISGYIYRGTSMVYDFVKDARVYAKLDGYYKGYSVSTINGFYQVDSLSNGTYEVIVDRMGYYPSTQFAYVNGGNITNFNFTLMAVLNAEKTGSSIPSEYSLYQNYPNPFNPQTEIHFALPKESEVRLVIFDMLGREIAVLANGSYKAGEYKVKWDSDGFSSGIYFYRFTAGKYSESKKMVLIR